MMRPNQQNNKNRQRGRNNNGGRKPFNPLSRNFESNGPDVKVRGNAAHIAERYVQLARDALASGDSVMAENYYQHAEHYFRIISAAQQQNAQQSGQFGQDSDGYDDENDDGGMNDAFEPHAARMPEEQPRFDNRENRGDRGERGERGERTDRPFRERNNERGDRRERGERFERNNEQRPAVAAESAEGEAPVADEPVLAQVEDTTVAVAVDAPVEPVAVADEAAPAKRPRRTRRPRRTEEAEATEGAQPELGELPAFITAGTAPAAE